MRRRYRDVVVTRIRTDQGALPEGPGWGIELDWAYVEKHRLG
jgi:L-alanine-DL-glutamate epimerase-like enolase superfamily enzyme